MLRRILSTQLSKCSLGLLSVGLPGMTRAIIDVQMSESRKLCEGRSRHNARKGFDARVIADRPEAGVQASHGVAQSPILSQRLSRGESPSLTPDHGRIGTLTNRSSDPPARHRPILAMCRARCCGPDEVPLGIGRIFFHRPFALDRECAKRCGFRRLCGFLPRVAAFT